MSDRYSDDYPSGVDRIIRPYHFLNAKFCNSVYRARVPPPEQFRWHELIRQVRYAPIWCAKSRYPIGSLLVSPARERCFVKAKSGDDS